MHSALQVLGGGAGAMMSGTKRAGELRVPTNFHDDRFQVLLERFFPTVRTIFFFLSCAPLAHYIPISSTNALQFLVCFLTFHQMPKPRKQPFRSRNALALVNAVPTFHGRP